MLGSLPNLERIQKICDRHQIPMILDACESLGATYDNQDPALFADVACYSFDFGKTITAGEGGAVVSLNQAVIDFAKSYRDHGHSFVPNLPRNLDSASFPGFNYRITELQAAILRAQLKKLPLILSLYSERWIAFVSNLRLEARDNYLRVENDYCEDLHDVIFLTNLSATLKNEIIGQVNELEIGIKNVPNALRWHSAFFWQHIHPEVAAEHSVKLAQARLADSIAINIDITAPIDTYEALGKIINKLL
jgi:8-amino-3,8-dideoxy-alpha-D-manno-octulosonate transaminase